jgi:ABC-type transport system substrate-binding protein
MDARDHGATGVRRRSAWRVVRAWSAAALLLAALAAGCGAQPTPSASPAPAASAMVATPAPTASPAPIYADTLRFGFVPGNWEAQLGWFLGFRQASGSVWAGILRPPNLVHAAIYRWDARYGVFPDLADGECFVPGDDGKIIRCRLVEAVFHDGTPVTADDVAYSFLVSSRPTWYPWPNEGIWRLAEVRVVDPRTVDFVLAAVDPTFLTQGLPTVPILPRHAVEASYAEFVANTKDLAAKDLVTLADTIDADLGREPPVCSPHVDAVAALFERLGVRLYQEDYLAENGTPDPCAYLRTASGYIRAAANALGATGLDAVAAAYPVLSINWQPIGTGPYRFVSEDANGIHLEAWPGYHAGPAATRSLDFMRTRADGSDLLDGTVDIFQWAPHDVAFQAAAASHGVRFATVLSTGSYYFLDFNVRPGRLFSDVNLRKALQLCVDLPRAVDAATGGTGTPVYGPVLPDSWAYDPDLPKPDRDVAAAKQLIEASGWQLGTDGVYARDGVRLAAPILARARDSRRTKMADLIAAQAGDCGMDLETLALGEDVYFPALQYPLSIPGTETPWDLFLFGWGFITDPGGQREYTSSDIVSAKNPKGFNVGGFSDPLVDRLDAEGLSTYDQAERAELLRQEQQEIAAQLPVLFLWTETYYDAVRTAVTTVDGPLDLTAPNWAWQPERMVVVVANP